MTIEELKTLIEESSNGFNMLSLREIFELAGAEGLRLIKESGGWYSVASELPLISHGVLSVWDDDSVCRFLKALSVDNQMPSVRMIQQKYSATICRYMDTNGGSSRFLIMCDFNLDKIRKTHLTDEIVTRYLQQISIDSVVPRLNLIKKHSVVFHLVLVTMITLASLMKVFLIMFVVRAKMEFVL